MTNAPNLAIVIDELDPAHTAAAGRWRRGMAALGIAGVPADVAAAVLMEAFAVTVAVIAGVWSGWRLRWLIEHRW